MKILVAVAGLLLVLGCAPDSASTSEQPGEEASAVTSPEEEQTSDTSEPTDDGDDEGGSGAVSVELPGLPIGGNGATFTAEEPTQCVDVNWTGAPLPDGVALQFLAFDYPPEFSVDSTPCSEAPCLGGDFQLTSTSGGCTVSITWNGETPSGSSLTTKDAEVTCPDQATCDTVQQSAEDAAGASIELTVFTDDGESSSDEGSGG